MINTLTRYVYITSRDRPGFVEFNFSIGDPSLYLEMILPVEAFNDFCKSNQVTFLTNEQAEAVAQQQDKWRYGQADQV
jgi:phenol hydroxylase P0 protein